MSFRPAVSSQTAQPAGNDNWKAQAFLNIYLPKPGSEGGRIKIGALPLKTNRKFDAKMIERLSTGGPEALAAMAKVVEWDFQLADGTEAPELPF